MGVTYLIRRKGFIVCEFYERAAPHVFCTDGRVAEGTYGRFHRMIVQSDCTVSGLGLGVILRLNWA